MVNSTTATPAFSFLSTAYRTEPFIAETIESVLAQTRPDWELIVVDNGMSDEIATIVAEYLGDERIRLVRQENKGPAGGVNAAADVARGRYLVVLHTDDHVLPGYCERIGAVLDAHPGIDAIGCDSYLFDDPGGRTRARTFFSHPDSGPAPRLDRRLTAAHVIGGHQPYYTGTYRREAWFAVGGYTSEHPLVEDINQWLRLINRGFDVRMIPDILCRNRVRPESITTGASNDQVYMDSMERTLTAAAETSGEPAAFAARDRRLRRYRYFNALRRSRWAFLENDMVTARAEAAIAFRQGRTLRSAAVLAGLSVAPDALRRAHPVKQRVVAATSRVARALAPGPIRSLRPLRRGGP